MKKQNKPKRKKKKKEKNKTKTRLPSLQKPSQYLKDSSCFLYFEFTGHISKPVSERNSHL